LKGEEKKLKNKISAALFYLSYPYYVRDFSCLNPMRILLLEGISKSNITCPGHAGFGSFPVDFCLAFRTVYLPVIRWSKKLLTAFTTAKASIYMV